MVGRLVMFSAAGLVAALSVATLTAYWALDARIFVIQPIGALPQGATLIVRNAAHLRPLDSPDAFCYREMGRVNLFCRAGAMTSINPDTDIVARFPYSATLYRMTGAPAVDR